MRQHFDLDPGLIYLNSGTHSICPRAVEDALSVYRAEYERNPSYGLFTNWGKLWTVQKDLAAFFNARPEDVLLRINVTHAMSEFILGAKFVSGPGEIVVTNLEYGAMVNQCRFRAERDGLTLRTLSLPAGQADFSGLTVDQLVRIVVDNLRPETRMLLLSHVMTSNGLLMPIREIARETRKRGVLLVVDGAHGPGSVDLDFSQLEDVDFYGGNLHKWMMGPKGTAFGWVAPRHHETLELMHAGWTTYDFPPAFQAFGEGNRFQGRMMLSGCHDFAPFYALKEMLEFWRKLGTDQIQARIRELQMHAVSEMRAKLGWKLLSPPAGPLLGPLLSYELPERLQAQGYGVLFELYEKESLQIAITPIQGRYCLRLSPHVYNTEDEISRAVDTMARRYG